MLIFQNDPADLCRISSRATVRRHWLRIEHLEQLVIFFFLVLDFDLSIDLSIICIANVYNTIVVIQCLSPDTLCQFTPSEGYSESSPV